VRSCFNPSIYQSSFSSIAIRYVKSTLKLASWLVGFRVRWKVIGLQRGQRSYSGSTRYEPNQWSSYFRKWTALIADHNVISYVTILVYCWCIEVKYDGRDSNCDVFVCSSNDWEFVDSWVLLLVTTFWLLYTVITLQLSLFCLHKNARIFNFVVSVCLTLFLIELYISFWSFRVSLLFVFCAEKFAVSIIRLLCETFTRRYICWSRGIKF